MSPLAGQVPAGPASDPLAQLRDIHLPEDAISQLPTAPGWWILALTLIVVSITMIVIWRRHRVRNRYRGEAQALLANLTAGEQAAQPFVQSINTLLKRAALAAYPDSTSATQFGEQWVRFLQNSAPQLTMPNDVEDYLINSSYQRPQSESNAIQIQQQVLTYAHQWLSQHLSERRLKRREANT